MDFDTQIQLANERRRRAQEIASQGFQTPQGRMVGGRYIRPGIDEALVQGLRQFGAMQELKGSEQEIQDLSAQRQKAVADALRNFGQASQGQSPAQLAPAEQQAYAQMGDTSPTVGGVKPDMNAAYGYLMAAPDAALRQAGMQGMIRAPEIAAERQFKQEQLQAEAQMRADQMRQQHEQRMEYLRQNNADRAAMQQEQRAFQQQMAQIAAANRQASAQPYFQPVQTAQGVMAFNARTGRVEPVMGPNGQPIIGAQADPALQANITGAETTARKQAESTQEARGEARKADMFLQQLTQAENILKQGPTESGAGAAVDAAGRLVGISTPGAQRAGQLEALSGWLVANVPRMEGPQSNFDVQNYMTMAGKIGDRTVPVAERKAALAEVRRLQQKYKASAEQRIGGQSNAPSMSTQDRQALDWANANPTDPRAVEIKKRLGQ